MEAVIDLMCLRKIMNIKVFFFIIINVLIFSSFSSFSSAESVFKVNNSVLLLHSSFQQKTNLKAEELAYKVFNANNSKFPFINYLSEDKKKFEPIINEMKNKVRVQVFNKIKEVKKKIVSEYTENSESEIISQLECALSYYYLYMYISFSQYQFKQNVDMLENEGLTYDANEYINDSEIIGYLLDAKKHSERSYNGIVEKKKENEQVYNSYGNNIISDLNDVCYQIDSIKNNDKFRINIFFLLYLINSELAARDLNYSHDLNELDKKTGKWLDKEFKVNTSKELIVSYIEIYLKYNLFNQVNNKISDFYIISPEYFRSKLKYIEYLKTDSLFNETLIELSYHNVNGKSNIAYFYFTENLKELFAYFDDNWTKLKLFYLIETLYLNCKQNSKAYCTSFIKKKIVEAGLETNYLDLMENSLYKYINDASGYTKTLENVDHVETNVLRSKLISTILDMKFKSGLAHDSYKYENDVRLLSPNGYFPYSGKTAEKEWGYVATMNKYLVSWYEKKEKDAPDKELCLFYSLESLRAASNQYYAIPTKDDERKKWLLKNCEEIVKYLNRYDRLCKKNITSRYNNTSNVDLRDFILKLRKFQSFLLVKIYYDKKRKSYKNNKRKEKERLQLLFDFLSKNYKNEDKYINDSELLTINYNSLLKTISSEQLKLIKSDAISFKSYEKINSFLQVYENIIESKKKEWLYSWLLKNYKNELKNYRIFKLVNNKYSTVADDKFNIAENDFIISFNKFANYSVLSVFFDALQKKNRKRESRWLIKWLKTNKDDILDYINESEEKYKKNMFKNLIILKNEIINL